MTAKPPYTILVVEDNPDSRLLLCHALRKKGYSVIEAINGRYAVVEASSHHPDLILMDLAMPEMDGITAVEHILRVPKLASTPIFAVSGFATRDVEQQAIAAGCTEVLEKPIDVEILLEKIEATLSAVPRRQSERRDFARHREVERVESAIRANWGITRDCPHRGNITSLSVKGCLLETHLILALTGKHVFIRFPSLAGNLMLLQGGVLYYLRNVGFGMEFRELTEEDSRQLAELVNFYSSNKAPDENE